jgi:FixJ family two-component response regulator
VPVAELSPIEEHVVIRVARGGSSHAIAKALGLSRRTVEWHLARARKKLERAAALHDRIQEGPRAPTKGGTK